MALITFTKAGETSWIPSLNPVPPEGLRRERPQVIQKTAGGTRYVYEKGVEVVYHTLTYSAMSSADKATFETFFDDVAKGARIEFVYTDRSENAHTVTFDSTYLSWREIFTDRFAIYFVLREEV